MTKYTKTEIQTMLVGAAKLFDIIHAHAGPNGWHMEDDGINLDEMFVVIYKDGDRHCTTLDLDDLVGDL